MAIVFPNVPAGVLPPEVLRTFRFLKSLPDEYTVWHHLAPWQKDVPDFLILNPEQQALIVKVSTASHKQVRPAAQLLLLEGQVDRLGENETRILVSFQHSLPMGAAIRMLILFPNIPKKDLEKSRDASQPKTPLWGGQEDLQPPFTGWINAFTGPSLDAIGLEQVRALFNPEIVVPAALTVRPCLQSRLEAGLTDYLLDFDQEAALKADLDLPKEGQSLSKDFRLSVVNGVAGSGKTLILLYRLRLLHDLFPEKTFLILTHNKPLIRDMKSRYHQLTGGLPKNIRWLTFNGWCRLFWPKDPPWRIPLGIDKRDDLITLAWKEFFESTAITLGMLRSEIDWFKDQILFDRSAYLSIERRGRGFRLGPEQRKQMYAALSRYQKLLQERGQVDWGDVPRRMWKFIQDGVVHPPQYDVVLVDEAQFFAPIWFDIIRRLVKPRSGHLFIVADPTQGFLGRGASWKSLGLDVRGKVQQLVCSHRTTWEILNFATIFYRQRISQEDKDEEILSPDLETLPHGAFPELIAMNNYQDEITRVVNEVAALAGQGFPLDKILVLHVDWKGVNSLIAALQKKMGPEVAADPKDFQPGNFVRVTTFNAGTGLESPVVFLVGLKQLFEEEQSLRLSDEEREKLILENTRKVYMAATRAGQRLVVTCSGELPSDIERLFAPSIRQLPRDGDDSCFFAGFFRRPGCECLDVTIGISGRISRGNKSLDGRKTRGRCAFYIPFSFACRSRGSHLSSYWRSKTWQAGDCSAGKLARVAAG